MNMPIHFVWTGGTIPDWAKQNLDRARELHPNREVLLHSDDVLWDGWNRYWDMDESLPHRGDLLKYSVARRFGGWIMDLDVWFLRPLVYYESVRFPPSAPWWGTWHLAYFGASPEFPWGRVESMLDMTCPKKETLWAWFHQWSLWGRERLFDVVPREQFCIGANREPALYARLINGLPTLTETRIIVHGHKTLARIPDSCLIP